MTQVIIIIISEIDVVQGCFNFIFSFFRYLIESGWFGRMKKYLGLDHCKIFIVSAHPGPIDNGPLFQENSETPGSIKDGLLLPFGIRIFLGAR